MNIKEIYALSIISGTIIGVGIFSLPYITLQVGFWVILGYFLVLGILVTLVHVFFGELAIVTPDLKRLPGFAKFHLGSIGEKIAFLSNILGLFGAILAYAIVGGEFLAGLFFPILGGNSFIWTLFYFALGAILIFFGIKAISRVEFWGLILFFLILMVIFLRSFSQIKLANLFPSADLSQLFLPYGVILFSLWGAALIPEAEEILEERKNLLKIIIAFAVLIPILVSLFFIYLVLGITGPQTTESALTGLRDFLSPALFSSILLLGFITTFTSLITIGLTLKKIFWYDLKINRNIAWALTCFIPLILFLIGVQSFIGVISVVGGIMLGIDGILILLMYQKIKGRKYLVYPLCLIFLLGIFYEIIYFVK